MWCQLVDGFVFVECFVYQGEFVVVQVVQVVVDEFGIGVGGMCGEIVLFVQVD